MKMCWVLVPEQGTKRGERKTSCVLKDMGGGWPQEGRRGGGDRGECGRKRDKVKQAGCSLEVREHIAGVTNERST